MKTRIIVLCAISLLAFGGIVFADQVTFKFDPNDLLDKYSTNSVGSPGKPTDQDYPRYIAEIWGGAQSYRTYNDAQRDTYVQWVTNLGEGEGISAFNIWLCNRPAAVAWGETLLWDTNADIPTGTAATGWNVEVVLNPWPSDPTQPEYLVQWYTSDPAYYLRPGGADIGIFSFSGTTVEGSSGTIWFGSYNGGIDDLTNEPTIPEQWSLHFDNTGTSPFAANSYSGWQGTLKLESVPEPTTMMLLGLGLVGLVGGRRKFGR